MGEVANARVHATTKAVPAVRLAEERAVMLAASALEPLAPVDRDAGTLFEQKTEVRQSGRCPVPRATHAQPVFGMATTHQVANVRIIAGYTRSTADKRSPQSLHSSRYAQ